VIHTSKNKTIQYGDPNSGKVITPYL